MRPSGSAPLAEAARAHYFRGAMRIRSRCPATPIAAPVIGRPAPSPSAAPNRTHTASTTCATTCTSGAATGTRPPTMRRRPSAIRVAQKSASGVLPAAAPGGTTSRCRAARPAPASLQSSSTRTMGSAWRATYNCRSEVRGPMAEVKLSPQKEPAKADALTSAI